MGVYYFFYNARTQTCNEKPIPGFGECTHVAKFECVEDQVGTFQSVISVNPDWLPTDIIKACPDYPEYGSVVYHNGDITYEASNFTASDQEY